MSPWRSASAAARVVLALRELTFVDTRGVRVIVYASIRARRAGRRLVLIRGPAQVQRLLARPPRVAQGID